MATTRAFEFPPAPAGVLVSYSGGKDSLVVLDLAVAHYGAANVEAMFMYFLPGLDYSRVICAYAAERWGVRVHQLQHWATAQLFREGVFCAYRPDCPDLRMKHIEAAIRARTGKWWIGYGYRAQESLERRAMLSREFQGIGQDPVRGAYTPIAYWSTRQVRAYLRRERIALAMGALQTRGQFGISLGPDSLYWTRAHFPADYRRIITVFPYATAQADRWPALLAARERAAVRVSGDSADGDHERAVQPADHQ